MEDNVGTAVDMIFMMISHAMALVPSKARMGLCTRCAVNDLRLGHLDRLGSP